MTDLLLMMGFTGCCLGNVCCHFAVDFCSNRIAIRLMQLADALWVGAVAAAAAAGWMLWQIAGEVLRYS